MKDIFNQEVVSEVVERINKLSPGSIPLWGKMNVAQMLAHCCVPYVMVYKYRYSKPTGFRAWLMQHFIKKIVVSEKPYKKNAGTAPEFLIKSERDFDAEKNRLIGYIQKTLMLGAGHFDHKESLSFGKLTKEEWNNMFYKHLDHHLRQFGV